MGATTDLGDALDRYVALLDQAAIGRICRDGQTEHDGMGRISAPEIRDLRDAGLITVVADAMAPWEKNPQCEGTVRDVEGDYNPELGSWQFLVEYAGTQFVVTARERLHVALAVQHRAHADPS